MNMRETIRHCVCGMFPAPCIRCQRRQPRTLTEPNPSEIELDHIAQLLDMPGYETPGQVTEKVKQALEEAARDRRYAIEQLDEKDEYLRKCQTELEIYKRAVKSFKVYAQEIVKLGNEGDKGDKQ